MSNAGYFAFGKDVRHVAHSFRGPFPVVFDWFAGRYNTHGGALMALIADRIEVDPQRCHGKPVIHGTRVLVRTVLGSLAAGDSSQRVAEAYGISVEDVQAAIAFANELVADWDHLPVGG